MCIFMSIYFHWSNRQPKMDKIVCENCNFRFAARQFSVRLGDIDLKRDDEPSAPVTFKVNEIRAHKQFSRVGFYNDIAILKLDRPARKSRYVIPLCLPPRQLRSESFAGRKTTVVGWGTTYYGGKESTVQRQALLPIWRNEDCDEAYFQPITKNFICAGYSQGGVDACQVNTCCIGRFFSVSCQLLS